MKYEVVKVNRKASLDVTRFVAVIAVVLIHTSASYMNLYQPNSFAGIFTNIFNTISRIGVPLFVMISGCLMLNERKEITFKEIFNKYIRNIIILYLVWSLLYSLGYQIILPAFNGEEINFRGFLFGIFRAHYHLWYLPMIAGLYLITPILRCFVKKENSKTVLYFIVLSFIFNFFSPLIEFLAGYSNLFQYINQFIDGLYLDFFCGYVGYYLIGWYVINIGIKKGYRIVLYIAGFASLIFTIIMVQIFTSQAWLFQTPLNAFILLISVMIFDLINNYYKGNDKSNNVFKKLSNLAFGVYVVHVAILSIFDFYVNPNLLPIWIILKWIIVCLISFGVTFVAHKTPLLKKIFKG